MAFAICRRHVHSDLLILDFELVARQDRALLSSSVSLRASQEEVEVEVSIAVFASGIWGAGVPWEQSAIARQHHLRRRGAI